MGVAVGGRFYEQAVQVHVCDPQFTIRVSNIALSDDCSIYGPAFFLYLPLIRTMNEFGMVLFAR
jgi:hypothetical protein